MTLALRPYKPDMYALDIHHLSKVFKDGTEALKDISLSVEQGDFFALLGPNGAGKSTTIGIIASLINKSHGSVKVFDHDIDHAWNDAKACIGVVPQEFNFNLFEKAEDIVLNNAGYQGVPRGEAKTYCEQLLKRLDLWDKRSAASRFLSGGMKRRLMIARAMIHRPKLLILDEPTAGVDIELRRSLWEFCREINAEGTTIILTTHYLEEAENLCRNVAIIDHGTIVEHTDMNSLLEKLNSESFIFFLDKDLASLPNIGSYNCKLIDDRTLEVEIEKGSDLNTLFQKLDASGIKVLSMKNKSNRLEELFVRMTSKAS